MNETIIGGKIFQNIQTDERVNSNLRHCLYCYVNSHYPPSGVRNTDYKIPLNAISEGYMWQCPACERIYLLKDEL